MGRKCFGSKPMTNAEKQRLYRKKHIIVKRDEYAYLVCVRNYAYRIFGKDYVDGECRSGDIDSKYGRYYPDSSKGKETEIP